MKGPVWVSREALGVVDAGPLTSAVQPSAGSSRRRRPLRASDWQLTLQMVMDCAGYSGAEAS